MDMVVVKTGLLSIFHCLGYHVTPMRRYRPVDLRDSRMHSLEAFYRYPWRRVLIEAPVRWGFGLFHYPLDRPPLLENAIQASFETPDQAPRLLREALSAYYQSWQPATAGELLGVPDSDIPALVGVPPWAVPWPWEPLDADTWRDLRSRVEARENSSSLGRKLSIEAGWKCCGPVDAEKLEVEVRRLMGLIESIRLYGLQRHDRLDGDITAVLLCVPDGEWRWQVIGGGHRFEVLASLGADSLPVRIERIVRRDEVEYWAGVANGTYSPEVALKLFDRCFEFLPRDDGYSSRWSRP